MITSTPLPLPVKSFNQVKVIHKEIQAAWRFSEEIAEALQETAKQQPTQLMDAVHRYSLYKDEPFADPDPGPEQLGKQLVDIYNACSRAASTCDVLPEGVKLYAVKPHSLSSLGVVAAYKLGQIKASLGYAWDIQSNTESDERGILSRAYIASLNRAVNMSLQFWAEILQEQNTTTQEPM